MFDRFDIDYARELTGFDEKMEEMADAIRREEQKGINFYPFYTPQRWGGSR